MIDTLRLRLSEVELSDAPFILALMNTKGWLQFIGDRGIYAIEDAQNYIQNSYIHSYQTLGFGMYKVSLKKEGTPIGLCGLVTRPTLGEVEIGFAFLPAYENQGYAYEAAKATLQYAATHLNIHVLHAITNKENFASQKLLKKLGLGFLRNIQLTEGAEEIMLFRTV